MSNKSIEVPCSKMRGPGVAALGNGGNCLFSTSTGRDPQVQFANYHRIPKGYSTFDSKMDSPTTKV